MAFPLIITKRANGEHDVKCEPCGQSWWLDTENTTSSRELQVGLAVMDAIKHVEKAGCGGESVNHG